MRLEKLFKVLVVGGSALTAGVIGCGDARDAADTRGAVVSADAGSADAAPSRAVSPSADASTRADGVSAWMSWFVPPEETGDAGVADAFSSKPLLPGAPTDAGPADTADAGQDPASETGVLAWLSWV